MLPIYLALIDEEEDKISFAEMYDKYKQRIYNISFKILQNAALAEESTSEVFLSLAKCYNKIKGLDPHKLDYYIVLTSRSTALDMVKKERKHMENIEYDDDILLTNDKMEEYDYSFLKECIKQLSFQDREILYLKFNCGLDFKIISETIGITSSAARKRLQYAKEHLRKLLEEGGVRYE